MIMVNTNSIAMACPTDSLVFRSFSLGVCDTDWVCVPLLGAPLQWRFNCLHPYFFLMPGLLEFSGLWKPWASFSGLLLHIVHCVSAGCAFVAASCQWRPHILCYVVSPLPLLDNAVYLGLGSRNCVIPIKCYSLISGKFFLGRKGAIVRYVFLCSHPDKFVFFSARGGRHC